jgi:hypothetical protein
MNDANFDEMGEDFEAAMDEGLRAFEAARGDFSGFDEMDEDSLADDSFEAAWGSEPGKAGRDGEPYRHCHEAASHALADIWDEADAAVVSGEPVGRGADGLAVFKEVDVNA